MPERGKQGARPTLPANRQRPEHWQSRPLGKRPRQHFRKLPPTPAIQARKVQRSHCGCHTVRAADAKWDTGLSQSTPPTCPEGSSVNALHDSTASKPVRPDSINPPPPNNALSAEARMSWTQTPTADRHWLTILCPRSLQDSWLLSQSLELTTS